MNQLLAVYFRPGSEDHPSTSGWLHATEVEELIEEMVATNLHEYQQMAPLVTFDLFINGFPAIIEETEGYDLQLATDSVVPVDLISIANFIRRQHDNRIMKAIQ